MKIEIIDLCKKFKDIFVLKNINIKLNEGRIYGFSGRNGSGKSVLLKIICGLYIQTSGTILYDGEEINIKKNFPQKIAAFIEKPSFLPNLSGFENLKLLASIKKEIDDKQIIEILKLVNLIEEKDKKFYKYSLGMKQKIGIAQALMEDNDVIILDEPFNAIERETVLKLKKHLKKLKKEGKTIIMTSHIKDDLDDICDDIYLFENGECKALNLK